MRRSLLTGPGLLLLWQIAPVQSTADSSGRIRISLGYGGGSYRSQATVTSCSGETLQSSTKEGQWTARTGEVEAWVSSRVRASVAVAGNSATPEVPARWLAGSLVALETPQVGIGGGVGLVGGTGGATVPLVYLRFGGLERRHYRFDVLLPDPPVSGGPWYRVSVGFNQGRRAGPRWLFGMASRGLGGSGVEWTGDFAVPVHRDMEFTLGVRMGRGSLVHEDIGATGSYSSWRLAGGLRVSLVH